MATKCPALELDLVRRCRANPAGRDIPVAGAEAASICLNGRFAECPGYQAVTRSPEPSRGCDSNTQQSARCPLLEDAEVRYCTAFPIRKEIPASGPPDAGPCLNGRFVACLEYQRNLSSGQNGGIVKKTGATKYFPSGFYRTCRPALCPACAYAASCLAAEKEEREVGFVEGFSWLADLNYSDRHVWLKARRDGTVRLGLDDFAQKLVGEVAEVELPTEGTALKKGEPFVTLRSSQGEVRLPSPIDGTVRHVNSRLSEESGLLNEDPYGQWILRMEPFDLDAALKDTTSGDATATWLERDVDRLRYRVDSELGVTAADGGALVRTVEKIDKSEWEKLVAEFLL